MKILWAKIDFLHPTNRGGQIRTLEMLRRIHSRHDVHYVAYDDPATPEGRTRASEYASHVHAVDRPVPARGSPQFFGQLGKNLFSPLPLAVGRYRSRAMQAKIAGLMAREKFDATVADFLSIAPNFADLSECVLFQHNVNPISGGGIPSTLPDRARSTSLHRRGAWRLTRRPRAAPSNA